MNSTFLSRIFGIVFAVIFMLLGSDGAPVPRGSAGRGDRSASVVLPESPLFARWKSLHLLQQPRKRPSSGQYNMEMPSLQGKRTCRYNLGMSHDCDYRDAAQAALRRKFAQGRGSPGKRASP